MSAPRSATVLWTLAFVVLAAAAALVLQSEVRQQRTETPAGRGLDQERAGFSLDRAAGAPLSRLFVTPPATGVVSLVASVDEDATDVVVDGPARLAAGRRGGDAFVHPDGPAGPLYLALPRTAAWLIDVEPGAEALRLDLAGLTVDALRVGPPLRGIDGTLPRGGHVDVVLGGARSTLLVPSGSQLDADLTLGAGALLLRVDADVRGRLDLHAGSGPATIVADAAVSVALHLPSDAPPLALEGTWWRHEVDDGVTWVRSPVPASPEDADVAVYVHRHDDAPLAIVYR